MVRKLRESAASDGETLAEPLVEPEPEDSFQLGVWLSQNAPTYVAVFTFALAFVTGIIWVTLKSTGEGNVSSSLYWVIGLNIVGGFMHPEIPYVDRPGCVGGRPWAGGSSTQ